MNFSKTSPVIAAVIYSSLAGCAGETAPTSRVEATALAIEGASACAIRGMDLTYVAPNFVASGVLEGECPNEVRLLTSGDLVSSFEGNFLVDEKGRFLAELPAPPPPMDGESPLTLEAFAGDGFARLDADFVRDPADEPAVAVRTTPAPELTDNPVGTWALSVRDLDTGETNNLAVARLDYGPHGLAFADACDPERIHALAEIEGDVARFTDLETGQLLGEGQFAPGRISVVTENQERAVELLAVRVEDVTCEGGRGIPIDFSGGLEMHMDERLALQRSLDPFVLAQPMELPDETLHWMSTRNGTDHLRAAAGKWFDVPTPHRSQSSAASTSCLDAETYQATSCPSSTTAHPGYFECSLTNFSDRDILALSGKIALTNDPNVYPGALLQGGYLDSSTFTPITIPRSGGTISLNGISMNNPKETVSEVTGPNMRVAQQQLLQRAAQQNAHPNAVFSWTSHKVSSYDQMMAKLGLSAKWPGGALKSSFSFNSSNQENYVVVQFTQRLYDLAYQPPARPEDVFRDGMAFHDPWGQLGRGNRPVYVGKVAYGRQLFLLVKTSHPTADLQAAVNAAMGPVNATVDIKHKKVLDDASVTYVAYGGEAQAAALPLQQLATNSSPGALFQAVAAAAANMKALTTSGSGEPIAYSIYDLITNRPAQVGYEVSYGERNCRDTAAQDFTYQLKIDRADRDIKAWVNTEDAANEALHIMFVDPQKTGWLQPTAYDLNDKLNTLGNSKLIVRHGNGDCFDTYADVSLLVDNRPVWTYLRPNTGWSHCGWHSEAHITVNPATGIASVTKDAR